MFYKIKHKLRRIENLSGKNGRLSDDKTVRKKKSVFSCTPNNFFQMIYAIDGIKQLGDHRTVTSQQQKTTKF